MVNSETSDDKVIRHSAEEHDAYPYSVRMRRLPVAGSGWLGQQ